MTADDRLRRTVTDESCCRTEAGRGDRLLQGGPQRVKDNANGTAISLFNTYWANILTMRVAAKMKVDNKDYRTPEYLVYTLVSYWEGWDHTSEDPAGFGLVHLLQLNPQFVVYLIMNN